MKIKKINCVDIVNALEYFLALFIILDCRSVYNHAIERNYHILEFTIALLFVMLSVGVLFKQYWINQKNIVYFFIIEVFVFVFFVINVIHVDAIRAYYCRFMIFLPFLILVKTKCQKEDYSVSYRLMDKISTIMVVLAIVSVLFWITGSVLHIIPPTNTFRFLWSFERKVNCFFGLYFEVEYDSFLFSNLYRNNGIFTESPMFSLALSLALFYRVLLKKEAQGKFITKSNLCLIVAIITTFSITGFIAVVLLFLLISFIKDNQNQRTFILRIVLILVLVCLFNFAESFLSSKLSSDSGDIRLNDYVIGFKSWKDAPIFGGGYEQRTYFKYIEAWRSHNVGFSNSIMWILSQGGLYLFILYILPITVFLIKSVKEHDKYKAFFALSILYLYGTTTFAYQYLSIILIGYFITGSMTLSRGHNLLRKFENQIHLT